MTVKKKLSQPLDNHDWINYIRDIGKQPRKTNTKEVKQITTELKAIQSELIALLNAPGWTHIQTLEGVEEYINEDKQLIKAGWAFVTSERDGVVITFVEGWKLVVEPVEEKIEIDDNQYYDQWDISGTNINRLDFIDNIELIKEDIPEVFYNIDYAAFSF